jgi:hypothetical protein
MRASASSFHSPYKSMSSSYSSPTRYLTPKRLTASYADERTLYYSPSRRSGSPMKGYEEDELAKTLKDSITNERDIEVEKQSLSLKSDFTLQRIRQI